MSFQAMTWAVEQDLKTNEKMVLIMLSNCSNHHTGQCNPSHKRLAKECGMSVSTLKRCIDKLEEVGYLKIEHRGQEGVSLPNQYHLNVGYSPVVIRDDASPNSNNDDQNDLGAGQSEPTPSGQCELGVGSERATKQESNPEFSNQEYKLAEADESASGAQEVGSAVVLSEEQQANQSETIFQSKCRLTWLMYKAAYEQRYGIAPVRNAKVNSQVKSLVQRLGEEAGLVAEFYVYNVNESFVVKKTHDLGVLLSGAESYRTQWATGRSMTNTRAQQMDSTQANASAADEAIAMLRARQHGAHP